MALLGLAAAEQTTLDEGRWNIAFLFTHLPEPPWALLGSRQPDPGTPFSKLADPRWTAALMGYMKDVEALRAQRQQLARGRGGRVAGAASSTQGGSEEEPRGRGRGRSRSTRGGRKGEEAAEAAQAP